MTKTIYYTDYLDEPISVSKAHLTGRFCKVFKYGLSIWKQEYYEHHVLDNIEYFLSKDENMNDVLADLIPKVRSFVTLNKRIQHKNFTVVKSIQFKSFDIIFKTCELYDEKNRLVCTQELDLVTEAPILESTEKELYGENNQVFARFEYDARGNLKRLWGMIVDDARIFEDSGKHSAMETITGVDSINKYFPNLIEEHPYYKDGRFLPD